MGNLGVAGIVRMIVVGLIVGILARFFYPGAVHMGIIMTIVLGIIGSFVAGLIGALIHRDSGEGFHPAGFIYSIIGAIIVIFIARNVLHLGY
ncbi:MAG TPA: GlsB/YeaQ/YmgE family stress response membrane protein [Rhizomicrobium sp.]|nr:GlsB/YeaQ/YmgE family stress response membrane protein [Rhizomicrobium sp.]